MTACEKMVYDYGAKKARRCKRAGRYGSLGKVYCGQHYAERLRIEARR